MIPGVTCSLDDSSLRWPTANLKKGSDFVGGVSDGVNGLAAMEFHRDDLHAKKAWFFAGDTVICLGAGIDSVSSAPVVTAINQCLLKSTVTVGRAGKSESISGADQNLQGVDWVDQDGLRYAPLQPRTLMLSAARRTGNWRTVFDSPATPKADVTRNVFTLWITHGTHVSGGSYAYSVAPSAQTGAVVKILSNTARVQAVKAVAKAGAVVGAVFWGAGSADLDGLTVKVDSPCLMLIDSLKVMVSDPTQKLQNLAVEIGGKTVVPNLPRGGDAGKSVEALGFQ
jgi:chondroitin AC lyase